MPKYVILSDFDGTIVIEDTALLILNLYGSGNWRKYDNQLLKGEITLEECLTKQFSTLKVPRETILKVLDSKIVFRPSFNKLALFCEEFSIPLMIVSAGLDFIIEFFLNKIETKNHIPIVSGISKYTSTGISFEFPTKKHEISRNFKEDLVLDYQEKGYNVLYIGDGSGDFYAAKKADIVYSVKDSELSRLCMKNKMQFYIFSDFNTILNDLSMRFQILT